ncbi:hypothetical protein [Streptomyces sp. NPDC040750]|uniref:hypothetical protein n=1 Tax=Streptomyces sp. NPDC040750 TaxID=3154491 RepID=UPI003408B93E
MQNEALNSMSVANGTFSNNGHDGVTGKFSIDQEVFKFTGWVHPSVDDFTSSEATLTYSDENDLTGDQAYKGVMGREDFEIKFENGVVLTGKLATPGFVGGPAINGVAKWAARF